MQPASCNRHLLLFSLAIYCATSPLFAQRIAAIEENHRVALTGHVHPNARAEFDRGRVDPSLQLASVTLIFKPSPSQQADLTQLLASQQDPGSANYHRWLTPEQYADRFGVSQDDLDKISGWLQQQGLKVTNVARGRSWVSFSGAAGQVEQAFGTEFHNYEVNGQTHFANATEPTIPGGLDVVVRSIFGLNDFLYQPKLVRRTAAQPEYTSSGRGSHYLAPNDFAIIYDVKPLHDTGITGAGQSMVVAGQTQIDLTDIQQFRSKFNLPASDPQTMLVPNTRDPGTVSSELGEADLDLEWAGSVAPNASLLFVYSNNVMDAVQYAIDQNLAPVLSVSYGLCEAQTVKSDALTMQTWAQQGNAQGITWFDAAGDSGGADCVSGTSGSGAGFAVDTPASIPEVTGVGGTEFNEGAGNYWNATNDANGASVLSYIPETTWNDSDSSGPAAGGGGASVYFSKPSWQTGVGVPNDGARDVPDVALNASANHDGYLVYTGGSLQVFGGTSAGAPSMAGIAVLLNQYLTSKGLQAAPGLGNLNPQLYKLAQTSPSAVHDITQGNNIVNVTCGARARGCTPGSYGFNAGVGYDQATGLGSVDAYNLITSWASAGGGASSRATALLTLSGSASSISPTGTVTLTAVVKSVDGGTPTGSVTFTFGGTNLGSATLNGSAGQATANLKISGSQLQTGSDTITAQYGGDSTYGFAAASFTVNVVNPNAGTPSISSVLNGASFRPSLAPGMILSVFGSQLAPSTAAAGGVPLPVQLAGVSATVNGVLTPLYYVSPGQINLQLPYETTTGSAKLVVNNNGNTATTSLAVQQAAPAIFVDQSGALAPTNSATRGSVISLYLTGAGPVSPAIATGAAPSAGSLLGNLPAPLQPTSVTIGNVRAPIQFVGIPPGLVGVLQVNCLVASGTPTGFQPVVVSIGGVSSPPATLTVH